MCGSASLAQKFAETRSTYAFYALRRTSSVRHNYEGRPINKLQNGIILLIFKI